jgi:hypothetical protein
MGRAVAKRKVIQFLARAFWRNGYFRTPRDPKGRSGGHRGYELRFSALTASERDEIVEHLEALGFHPGRPFQKGPHWRIPVYGKAQVDELGHMLRELGPKAPARRAKSPKKKPERARR